MKKILLCCSVFLMNCDYGNLAFIADLPKKLREVSGIEFNNQTKDFWMLNDSGNPAEIYKVSKNGKILQTLKIDEKNHDWEDLTKDNQGNYYIADFGNNQNNRKNLSLLIIEKNEFDQKKAAVKKIKFSYPDQAEFPPEKDQLLFDAEGLLYFKNHLYIFTKTRINGHFGKTNMYKVPAKKGVYKAVLVSSFENCNDNYCWITSAAISPNNQKVVLLSQRNLLVFSEFKGDDFFSGKIKTIPFTNYSQKESISFKDNNTVYITDERARGKGGNLYELKIN